MATRKIDLEKPAAPVIRSIPRRVEKIAEVVAREIVRDMRGLPPSTMLLPEAVMLEKYGVARNSLREALRILEVQGLIIIRPGPGGGPMVAGVDSKNFARTASLYLHLSGATYRDVMEARLVMEPVMARLAAQRQDPQKLAELKQSLIPPPENTDATEYLSVVREFHAVIAGMSGNPALDLMSESMKHIYASRMEYAVFPAPLRSRVEDAHQAITRAVVHGHTDKAEKLMREHMEEFVAHSMDKTPDIFEEVVDWH